MTRPAVTCCFCAGLGLAFSTGHPAGMILSVFFPAASLNVPRRSFAWLCAGCYYAGAAWSLVPAARNFFGPNVGFMLALSWWLTSAALLSLPWAWAWTKQLNHRWWRCIVALAITVVPPLGLIGWASPLTASGYLFPGTSWFGILGLLCGVAGLCASPRCALAGLIGVVAFANAIYDSPPALPWKGINTQQRPIVPNELAVVEDIQRLASESSERVIVFPEAVVPQWNASTEVFWEKTLHDLRAAGKTIIVGTKITSGDRGEFTPQDFSAAVAILKSPGTHALPGLIPKPPTTSRSFRNVLVIRGSESAIFEQRVPVPFGMWRPFEQEGVRLRLDGQGTINLAGERVAVLVCYEQLLTWPILASMREHPTALIAVANDHWSAGTTIPQVQLSAVRAWARLNKSPYVSATNF